MGVSQCYTSPLFLSRQHHQDIRFRQDGEDGDAMLERFRLPERQSKNIDDVCVVLYVRTQV